MILGTFQLQAIVYHVGYSPFQGHYKSYLKYDNIWHTTMTSISQLVWYPTIYENIGNNPWLISNVEIDTSRLSNELHNNTYDVLEKINESYETEITADEWVVLEELYWDYSEFNIEYNTSDSEKTNIDLVVTEPHRFWRSEEEICIFWTRKTKKKLMLCKETKSPVRR